MPVDQRKGRFHAVLRVRKVVPVLAGLVLAGCSLGSVIDSASEEPDGEPDYKKLILDGAASMWPGSPPNAALEVSALRRSVPLQPGDWAACLRRTTAEEKALFAIFFKRHKIESVRRAVQIDKCEEQTYSPLKAAK